MTELLALLELQVAAKDAHISTLQDRLEEARAVHEADDRTITALALELAALQVLLQERDATIASRDDAIHLANNQTQEAWIERDAARAWVRRMHAEHQTLTCVYCGQAYPPGTPASGSAVLTAHIAVCEKHPLRAMTVRMEQAQQQLEALRTALRDGVADGIAAPASQVNE